MNKTKIKIDGDKIYLREVELSDVNQTYVNWLNDPKVNQYLETRYEVQTMDSVRKYVEGMITKEDELFFSICLKENDIHIGNIKLGPINPVHKFAEVSLFIGDKNYWGRSLATVAISILSDYAINNLKLHKLKAGCYSGNIGSAKAFLKVGYKLEGTLKNQWIVNGQYQDELLFGYFVRNREG